MIQSLLMVATLLGVLTLAGCKKGPAEKVGENLDKAAEKTGDAAKDAGNAVKDAVDK